MLTGIPATLAFLAVGALCALLAWGTYHRRPAAWWGLVATWILGCVNGAFLMMGGGDGLRQMYVAMGTPELQLQQMERMGIYTIWSNPVILALMVLVWLGWLGFLIWMKRFFTARDEAGRFPALQFSPSLRGFVSLTHTSVVGMLFRRLALRARSVSPQQLRRPS